MANSAKKGGFGERIVEFIDAQHMSRKEFAVLIDVTYDKLQSYIQEKAEPRHEFWQKIKKKFPVADISAIMIGVPNIPLEDIAGINQMIPVVSTVHAGRTRLAFADEDVIEWLPFVNTKDKEVFAVKVVGDSMAPEINNGDYAICAPYRPFISGKIYLVVNDKSEHNIKRVYKEKNGYRLIPANPEYDTVFLEENQIEKFVRVINRFGALE